MALGVLDIYWRDSPLNACKLLGKQQLDFNNKTVIEIAHEAKDIHFLAHPCCQKWLTKKYLGHLRIKELKWGLFRLPCWFKILTSVFLVFPMLFWISFTAPLTRKTNEVLDKEVNDYDYEVSDDEEEAIRSEHTMNNCLEKPKDVPFPHKVKLLWSAPITKYHTTYFFYFMYLAVFCFATLWPDRGNQRLDWILVIWTGLILFEVICRLYNKCRKQKAVSRMWNILDIALIAAFLLGLVILRFAYRDRYLTAKMFLSSFLVCFFYRLLGYFLLNSLTLGPMLLTFYGMVMKGLFLVLRMFSIFMIASGVAIQAVIYPKWPINDKLITRVFIRPILAIFITEIDDLEGDSSCSPKYDNISSDSTMLEETCPFSSFPAYVITLQYLFICKLVLLSLLYALFTVTANKVDVEATKLWMFYKYEVLVDIKARCCLAPPLNAIYLVYCVIKCLLKLRRNICRNCSGCCEEHKESSPNEQKGDINVTAFWRRLAKRYAATEQAKSERESLSAKQVEILKSIQVDLKSHTQTLKRLSDNVVEVERLIKSNRLCLKDDHVNLNIACKKLQT